MLRGFLKIRDACPVCGLSFSFADPADGPAFFGMSIVGTIGMAAFMAFDFTFHPPILAHVIVTFPLLALACLGVLRPLKGWLISEQYVHKAAEAEFLSVGKHGEGRKWR